MLFGAMKTAVSKRLLDKNGTSVPLYDVGEAINDAVGLWKKKIFWFSVKSALLPLSTNPVIPNFPSDVLYPLDFSITLNNNGIVTSTYLNPLQIISPLDYDTVNYGQAGYPSGVTFINGAWTLTPYPLAGQTVKVNYVKDYTRLTDDADTNQFLTYADRLIMMQACSNLTGEFQQDDKMSPYYENEVKKEERELKRQNNKIIGSKDLTPYGILDWYQR